ncbi:hypothetical protein GGI35DRAFT_471472 [Trichoderma velutinum]
MRKKGFSQFIGRRKVYQTSNVVVENNAGGIKVRITHANPTSITIPASATNDITISYDGGRYTRKLLEIICNRLFSCLFYIELDALPTFYHDLEVCSINVLCRLAPGNALLDLLYRFFQRKVCIYYQGSNLKLTKALLCTHNVMDKCRQNQPFIRRINVAAQSRNTQLSIRMDGTDGKTYALSNCPYRLSKLIRDQELESPFGSYGNQHIRVGRGIRTDHSALILRSEIDQLLEAMEFII